MFSTVAGNNLLYKGAALYATTTAFAAFWLTVRQPIQAGKEGPYNVHRVLRQGRRIPWRRLPKAL